MSAQQRAYAARRILRRANQPAAVSAYVRELLRELGMGAARGRQQRPVALAWRLDGRAARLSPAIAAVVDAVNVLYSVAVHSRAGLY